MASRYDLVVYLPSTYTYLCHKSSVNMKLGVYVFDELKRFSTKQRVGVVDPNKICFV